jgi:hypothetical protein
VRRRSSFGVFFIIHQDRERIPRVIMLIDL